MMSILEMVINLRETKLTLLKSTNEFFSSEHKIIMTLFVYIAVWEVRFHPTHSDNLFTCSDDGSIWHWDGTSMSSAVNITNTSLQQAKGTEITSLPWNR